MSHEQILRYNIAARIFHWVGALLIIAAVVSINADADMLHKSIGASFLIWTVLRLINFFIAKKPAPVPAPKWQTALAHLTHLSLYALMFAMPITGMLMSMYAGGSVSVFGLFSIAGWVTPDRAMSSFMNTLHTEIVFPAMLLMVVLHVAAALYHQFIVKDGLIERMM